MSGWTLDPVTNKSDQWTLDPGPALHTEVPAGVNAAAGHAIDIQTQKQQAEADARKQLDVISQSEPMKGVDTQGNLVDIQTPPGQFVRQEGTSPTDVMNQSEFIPQHVPGYNPKDLGIINPMTGVKEKLPDWATPYAAKINDLGIGVADTLANAISVPVDGLINAFRGSLGQDIFKNPASSREVMGKWMTDHGIPNTTQQAFDNWWSDLGSQAAQQGMLSLALIAGAGPLSAAGEGVTALGSRIGASGLGPITSAISRNVGGLVSDVGSVATKVGKMAQEQPGQVLAADTAATIGGPTLAAQSDWLKAHGLDGIISDPTVLSYIGSIVAGMLGGTVAGMGRVRPGLTSGVGEGDMSRPNGGFGGLPRFGGKAARNAELSQIPANPIINLTERNFNPQEIARAVQGYQSQVSSWIDDSMARITTGAKNPAVAAGRVVQMMDQAWKKATAIRNGMYNGIDVSKEFDPTSIQQAAQSIQNKVIGDVAAKRFLPTDVIDEILTDPNWVKKSGGEYELGVKTPVTYSARPISIDRARQMISAIGSQTAELRKIPGTQQKVAYLVQLSNAISDAMDNAFPTNYKLKQANEFTRWLHTRFDMGPAARMGQVRLDDAALQDSRQAMAAGMRHEKFGGILADIGKTLGNDPAINARLDNYLRSTVADIAQRAENPLVPPEVSQASSARAASQYLRSSDFTQLVKSFPKLYSSLSTQTDALNTAISKQLEINSSKFFSLAGNEPETAAKNLVSSGTKLKDAAMVVRTIGNDKDARDALQFAVIRQLGQSVEWDPVALKGLINSKDNKAMLEILMSHSSGNFSRMNKLLDAMVDFQGGPMGSRAGRIRTTIKTGGRIAGLIAARFLGAKSIQSHAIGAQLGSTVLSDLFNIIPPDQMLANALVDPRWERFALSKVPANMSDFNNTSKVLGALVGTINASHRQLMDQQETNK